MSESTNTTPNAFTEKSRHFSLIELMSGVVIIASLVIMALPKTSGITSEARQAALLRAAAEISASAQIAFYKCQLIQGCYSSKAGNKFLAPSGVNGSAWYGWPSGQSQAGASQGIKDWITVSGFSIDEVSQSTTEFKLNDSSIPDKCLIRYTAPSEVGSAPKIDIISEGC